MSIAICLALSEPSSGRAQDASVEESDGTRSVSRAQLESSLERGVALRMAGDDRGALEVFRAAWRETGSVRALAQMAMAEQALGRWLDAREHVTQALEDSTDPWIARNAATLRQALSEITSRLGLLEVSSNVVGAELRVDGRSLGRLPLQGAVHVVAGESVVTLVADGYFPLARQVRIDSRGLARVRLYRTRVGDEPEAGATSSPYRDGLMYASLGLAATGVVVGVTGWVLREVNLAVYNDDETCLSELRPRRDNCPDESAAYRRGETLAAFGFVGAAVFGGLGAYLVLSRDSGDAKAVGWGCAAQGAFVSCLTHF